MITQFDHISRAGAEAVISPRGQLASVVLLLAIQAGLIAFSAAQHSPTDLEPAFLASGISHWHFGRFELFKVNPPMPRMVAAIPSILLGCKTDWKSYRDSPGGRAEFPVGADFVTANGERSGLLVKCGRWICIPFATLGAYIAYRWATEIYGAGAGLVTLVCWVFEPNLLAHSELITSDSACISLGITASYCFAKWLQSPTWFGSVVAGVALGFAQLAKLTWVFLFALWPAIWLVYLLASPKARGVRLNRLRTQGLQLFATILVAIYLVNSGYAFDGTCTRLRDFHFASVALTGGSGGGAGNRFSESLLGRVPIPLPKQYVLGLDTQRKDLESYASPSYLRGVWKQGGWWYYYLYGFLVKTPIPLLALFLCVVLTRLVALATTGISCDEWVLAVTGISLFTIISSHTAFNHHVRYALPCLAIAVVGIGATVRFLRSPRRIVRISIALLILSIPIVTLRSYPHSISFFNAFFGGADSGYLHLSHSSLDWSQDLALLKGLETEKNADKYRILLPSMYNPLCLGVKLRPPTLDELQLKGGSQVVLLVSPRILAGEECNIDSRDGRFLTWPFQNLAPGWRLIPIRKSGNVVDRVGVYRKCYISWE